MRALAASMILGLAVAALAAAQVSTSPVLQNVYIGAATVPETLAQDVRSLVDGIPEMLATSLSSRQPFTQVDTADRARSVITVAATDAGANGLTVAFHLQSSTGKADDLTRTFAGTPDLAAFVALINDAAARFAPQLGPVPPEVDVLKVTSQQELVVAARDTDYLNQLDKRFSFTLWGSGLLRLLDSTGVGPAGQSFFAVGIFPLIAEADWFFSRNLGALVSFDVNLTNHFDFGHFDRDNATGLFLFPGVGLVYRTLGQISAEYAITLSAGLIHLTADAGDIHDNNGNVVLPRGASLWSPLIFRLRIAPSLIWNVTTSLALKTTIGFDFIFPGSFPWYVDSPLADFQFLGLGVAWRM
jgi:hypothetical protein